MPVPAKNTGHGNTAAGRRSGRTKPGGATDKETSRAAKEATPDTPPAKANTPAEAYVTRRRRQYLIAEKPGPSFRGMEPLDMDAIEQACKEHPDIEYKKTITSRHVPGPPGTRGMSPPQSIVVAEMPRHHAEELMKHPRLVVEQDHPLTYMPAVPSLGRTRDPGVRVPSAVQSSVTITVLDKAGAPVAGATVYLFGESTSHGVTDQQGQVQLSLLDQSVASVTGLYVNPTSECWSLWVERPALDPNLNNVVVLTSLTETFPEFPAQPVLGWGHRAMRLDQLPADYRGQGVRVAVIDSGVATTHPDLTQAKAGFDVMAQNDQTWNQDAIAHGSHCAGVIAGADNGMGIRGFAPDAELHVLRIFPEGRFSDLMQALDYCIEHQIDIANLSLGTDQGSELLDQKIEQAKQAGVACIVAAGNSEGPVRYPANSSNVLAVAAIGKEGEYPSDSYHATQPFQGEGVVASNGYYSPRFTCHGPEVDVCAPGVAILSSVPDTGYAAWDGTSMATPHVTGLAALILAHHDDFKGPYQARDARRVERLFELLKQSCQPLNFGDPNRTGAGMPDAVAAFRTAPSAAPPLNGNGSQAQNLFLQQLALVMQQLGLLPPGLATRGGPSPSFTLEHLTALMQQAGLVA
jgi:subtilisin